MFPTQDVVMMCHEVEKALDRKLQDMPAQVSTALLIMYVLLCMVCIVLCGNSWVIITCFVCGDVSLICRKWRFLSLQREGRRELV